MEHRELNTPDPSTYLGDIVKKINAELESMKETAARFKYRADLVCYQYQRFLRELMVKYQHDCDVPPSFIDQLGMLSVVAPAHLLTMNLTAEVLSPRDFVLAVLETPEQIGYNQLLGIMSNKLHTGESYGIIIAPSNRLKGELESRKIPNVTEMIFNGGLRHNTARARFSSSDRGINVKLGLVVSTFFEMLIAMGLPCHLADGDGAGDYSNYIANVGSVAGDYQIHCTIPTYYARQMKLELLTEERI